MTPRKIIVYLPPFRSDKDIELDDGKIILVEPGKRAIGSRSPVHTQPNSGATCVLRREMTLILEGTENQTFRGNIAMGIVKYYPMPAPDGINEYKMSAVNTGSIPALIIDIFPVPEDTNPMDFKPMCVLQSKGLPDDPACYVTGSGCTVK